MCVCVCVCVCARACACLRVFKRAFKHFLTEAILFHSKAIQVDILLSPKRKDSRATPARKRSVVRLVCICVVWLLCVSEVHDLLICVLVHEEGDDRVCVL